MREHHRARTHTYIRSNRACTDTHTTQDALNENNWSATVVEPCPQRFLRAQECMDIETLGVDFEEKCAV